MSQRKRRAIDPPGWMPIDTYDRINHRPPQAVIDQLPPPVYEVEVAGANVQQLPLANDDGDDANDDEVDEDGNVTQGCEEDPSQGLLDSSSPATPVHETNYPDSELDYLVNLCGQNESTNLLDDFHSEHPGDDFDDDHTTLGENN